MSTEDDAAEGTAEEAPATDGASGFGGGFGSPAATSKPALLGQGEPAAAGGGFGGGFGSGGAAGGFGGREASYQPPSLFGGAGFASLLEPKEPSERKALVPAPLKGGVGAPSPLGPHLGRRTPGEVATSSAPSKTPGKYPVKNQTTVKVKVPVGFSVKALGEHVKQSGAITNWNYDKDTQMLKVLFADSSGLAHLLAAGRFVTHPTTGESLQLETTVSPRRAKTAVGQVPPPGKDPPSLFGNTLKAAGAAALTPAPRALVPGFPAQAKIKPVASGVVYEEEEEDYGGEAEGEEAVAERGEERPRQGAKRSMLSRLGAPAQPEDPAGAADEGGGGTPGGNKRGGKGCIGGALGRGRSFQEEIKQLAPKPEVPAAVAVEAVKTGVSLLGDGEGEEEDEEARKRKRASRFGDGKDLLAKAKAREQTRSRVQPPRVAKPSLIGREFESEAASGEIRISAYSSQILTSRRRNAGDIVGSCEEMMPDHRVAKRLAEHLSHPVYEVDVEGQPVTSWHITENMRTWEPQNNADCRSLGALMKTCRYIMVKVLDSDTKGFEGKNDFTQWSESNFMCMYLYIQDRFRQISRELRVQGCLETPESVKVHEQQIRFQILSCYALCYKFNCDPGTSMKLREEHKKIGKCFITLFACYSNPAFPVEAKRCEAEMKAYFILLKAHELQKAGGKESLSEISKALQNVSSEVRSHPLIALAWEAFGALGGFWTESNKQINYAKFFKMLMDPNVPFLFTAMLHCNVDQVRVAAGKSICRNSGGGHMLARAVPVGLAKLERVLCFEDTQHCLDWCDYYSLEVRTREEHVEALKQELSTKEAEGQLAGMSGKSGIEEELRHIASLDDDHFLMTGKGRDFVEVDAKQEAKLKKEGYWVVEPRTMSFIDAKQMDRSNGEIVAGLRGLEAETVQDDAQASGISGGQDSRRLEELEAKKAQMAARMKEIQAKKAAKRQEAEQEAQQAASVKAAEEAKVSRDRELAAAKKKKAEEEAEAALVKKQRMDEIELQRQRDEAEKERRRQEEAAAQLRAIREKEAKEKAEAEERARQVREATEEAARQEAHRIAMEEERKREAEEEARRRAELDRLRREEEARQAAEEARRREEAVAEEALTKRKEERQKLLRDFRENPPTADWSSTGTGTVGRGVCGVRMSAPTVDVFQSVGACLAERNPGVDKVCWKFLLGGKEPKSVSDAVHWVAARLRKGKKALAAPQGPCEPLFRDSFAVGSNQVLTVAGVRVDPGKVVPRAGRELEEWDYIRTQCLLFVTGEEKEARGEMTERERLRQMVQNLPKGGPKVPLLVFHVGAVFSNELGKASFAPEGLEAAALEATRYSLTTALRLSELPMDSISAVEVLTVLRTEAGDEVAPLGGLSAGLTWLAERSTPQPVLSREPSLHAAVCYALTNAWGTDLRAGPVDYINLYNLVVTQVAQRSINSVHGMPWPPGEFSDQYRDSPAAMSPLLPMDWNSSERLLGAKQALAGALLPPWHGSSATGCTCVGGPLQEGLLPIATACSAEEAVIKLCLGYYAAVDGLGQASSVSREVVLAGVAEFKTANHQGCIGGLGGVFWAHFFYRIIQERLSRLQQATMGLGACYMNRDPALGSPAVLTLGGGSDGTCCVNQGEIKAIAAAPPSESTTRGAIVPVGSPAKQDTAPTPDKRRRLAEIDAGIRCGMSPATIPWEARVVSNAGQEDPLVLRFQAAQAAFTRERAAFDAWDANAMSLDAAGSSTALVAVNERGTKKRGIDELLAETSSLLRDATRSTQMQTALIAQPFHYQ